VSSSRAWRNENRNVAAAATQNLCFSFLSRAILKDGCECDNICVYIYIYIYVCVCVYIYIHIYICMKRETTEEAYSSVKAEMVNQCPNSTLAT
jgi:hypothetical protein